MREKTPENAQKDTENGKRHATITQESYPLILKVIVILLQR